MKQILTLMVLLMMQGIIIPETANATDLPLNGLTTPVSQMEKLTRGLVVLPAEGGGQFISWRMLGTDPLTTTFDLLRNGKPIVKNIGNRTNYTDEKGTLESNYQVVTVVDGVAVDTTEAVSGWSDQYKVLQLNRPEDGIDDLTGEAYSYTPNDCSLGDVDGDGVYEIIVQWQPSNKTDNACEGKHPGTEYIDCYKLNGEMLWRINMGMNILAGDHHTQILVYDFDGDGQAEVMLRTAPGTMDGKGNYVNQVADEVSIRNADNTKDWRSPSNAAIIGGQEYLTVFEGATGKAIHTIFYNPNRDTGYGGEATGLEFNWDDRPGRNDYVATYGNRGNRFLAAVAYLDGKDKNPSAVMCRGYYTQAFLWAVDFDGQKLRHKWLHASISKSEVKVTDAQWNVTSKTYSSNTFGTSDYYTAYGQGNHNLSVADVDDDGCDEIIYGGATIDNDGWLLYSTGLCHGDAMHVADIMPDRPGFEVYRCCEASPYGSEIHDARTGEKIYHQPADKDTGRCMAADIMESYRGYEFWAGSGQIPRESITGDFNIVSETNPSFDFRIYWDGDLQDELFDGCLDTETGVSHPIIEKWNGTDFSRTNIDFNGSQTCNWTKATPCLQADILGDWREELIMWNLNDPSQLNIIATNIPSNHRVPTLMHDHNYRLAIAWQNVAYNQPPHLGYYLPDTDFSYKGDAVEQILSNEYEYTVNEVVEDKIMRSTTGKGDFGSEVAMPYRRYNVKDGKLYFKAPSGGSKRLEYNHYFTLTTDGQTENLYYDQTDVTDVVFLSEAEDIPGMTPCDNDNMRVRSSNCLAAYAADGAVAFVTLPAGSYQLTAFIHDASKKYPDSYWSFLAGDREIANFHCDVVNIQEFQSDVFTLSEETTLYIPQSGNAKQGIDLIYITKQKQTPVITANNITMTYGSDVPELTYTVQNFDGELDGTLMLSTTATKTSPVGTYPIKIEKGTLTYENVIFVDGTLTITQAPLTVSVQDVTITRGEEMPSFTLKCEGLRNNETEDVAFTKKPTAKTYAQNDSPAGVYEIYLDGGEAPNYAISYSPGKLTILPASGDKWRDLSFKREITHPQPMTGLVLRPGKASELHATYGQSIQLEYEYYLPCDIVKGCNEDGTIIYDWSSFDDILNNVASRGHQLVPRFRYEFPNSEVVDGKPGTTAVPDYIKQLPDYHETYSESQGTYYADWSNVELQRFTLQFYTDFFKRYAHDPRLAFLQVGFGHWSEYHIYPTPVEYGKNFPSLEYQKKFLIHMSEISDGLPWNISKNAGDTSPIPSDEELLALQFGLFEDSFMGEYFLNDGYKKRWNSLGGQTRWQIGVVGGEVGPDYKENYNFLNPEGLYGHFFEDVASKYHVTFMGGNCAPDNPYGTPERLKQASMATGYRFVVKKCATDGSKTMMLVGNEGIAPIYRDAYFAIGDVRSETSLKGLLPNEEMWIEIAARPRSDGNNIRIVCDYILPQQEIEFEVKSDHQMFTYTVNEVVNGNVVCSTAGQGVPNTEITMPYRAIM